MSRRINPPKNAIEETQRLAADGYSIIGIAKHLGVSRDTFKRWCDEDDALQEAFEVGRETERQALHSLIKRDATAGKSANANAMFLLKCRHGYREFESPNTKVDVNVAVASPVMVVTDHGTDEQWAAKVAEQQRRLAQDSAPQLEAPRTLPETLTLPIPSQDAGNAPKAPSYLPPSWKART